MDNIPVNETTQAILKSFENWFGNWLSPPDKTREKYYLIPEYKSTYVYFKRNSTTNAYMPASALVFLRANDRIIRLQTLHYSYRTEKFWVVEIPEQTVSISEVATITFLDSYGQYASSIDISQEIANSSKLNTLYTPLLLSTTSIESRTEPLALSKTQIIAHMLYSIKSTTLFLDLKKRLQYDVYYPEENPAVSFHELDVGDNDVGVTQDQLYTDTIKPLLNSFAFIRKNSNLDAGLVCSFGKLDYYWLTMSTSTIPSICAIDTVLSTVREFIFRASNKLSGTYTDSEKTILLDSTYLSAKCKLFLSIQETINDLKTTNGTGWFRINERVQYPVKQWKLDQEGEIFYENKELTKLLSIVKNIECC